jgi:hypothetical protein
MSPISVISLSRKILDIQNIRHGKLIKISRIVLNSNRWEVGKISKNDVKLLCFVGGFISKKVKN